LSDDLATFVLDRQREQTRLPPIETNPSDLNSVRRNWDRSRDFSNETSILLQNRYGPRIIEALAELDTLSIRMTFMVGAAGTSNPQVWAKWFGFMSIMIAQGRIVEARTNSADQDFWFKQSTP